MIDTTLVYIRTADDDNVFIGCGSVVEGPFIVTCRHVWRDAKGDENGEVTIVFPRSRDEEGELIPIPGVLGHSCDEIKPKPDLVILSLKNPTPENVDHAGIATSQQFETGNGGTHAFISSRGRDAK